MSQEGVGLFGLTEQRPNPNTRVHNHRPWRPMCNERLVDGQLRGACLKDDGTDRGADNDALLNLARAQAWYEGHAAGLLDATSVDRGGSVTPNPYCFTPSGVSK